MGAVPSWPPAPDAMASHVPMAATDTKPTRRAFMARPNRTAMSERWPPRGLRSADEIVEDDRAPALHPIADGAGIGRLDERSAQLLRLPDGDSPTIGLDHRDQADTDG